MIAPLRHPGYHNFTSQMVSELMAVGAPTRHLLIWLFTPYNLLVFAFAAGVWASAQGRRSVRLTAAALVGYGVVSNGRAILLPDGLARNGGLAAGRSAHRGHVRDVDLDRRRDGVRSLRARKAVPLYSLATIAIVVVFGTLAGLLARPMPGSTPGLGLAERVNIYATMLWMASLAASLWRPQS